MKSIHEFYPPMKRSLLLAVLGLGLICGCSRQYVITLNNGARVTTNGKPKIEDNSYVFKDATGQKVQVPVGRVREIAPASMVKEDKTVFKPETR
jgi:hypothetical protein